MTLRKSLQFGPPSDTEYRSFTTQCMKFLNIDFETTRTIDHGNYNFLLQLKVGILFRFLCGDALLVILFIKSALGYLLFADPNLVYLNIDLEFPGALLGWIVNKFKEECL